MNSMERVMATMQGAEVDQRAVSATLSLYGAKLTGCPLKEYYTRPAAYLEGQIAVIEQCRPDVVFSPFVLTAEAEAFGSEVVYIDQNPPNLKKPIITNASEIGKLPQADIDSDPRLGYLRESTRLLARHCKGNRPVAGVLTSPVDLPALIMGIDGWLETLLFDPQGTRRMIDKMVTFFIGWANTLLAEGATFLAVPSMFSNPKLLTPKLVYQTVLPILSEAFAEVAGPIVFHHGGNPIGAFLAHYAQLPNVAAFLLDNRDSFAEAREKIEPTKILMGNINGPNLWRLTPDHIRHICRRLLNERENDRFFMVATSGADVAYDTPLENITALMESVKAGRAGDPHAKA